MKSKWIKSFVIMVLLMCLMATPCYAVMIPQDSMTTTFSKSMNNPAASNDYWLVYGYNPAPYQVYRVAGSFRGNLSSSYTTYWQFRDSSGNVIYSFSTTGTNVRTLDLNFADTPFTGFYLYAKINNTSVASTNVTSDATPLTIYYGSNVADQDTAELTLTEATSANTNASTAASRALNNYNILNNSTKGLYKTYDIANIAATNTSYGGDSAAYLAYLASEDAGYVRDTLIPSMQTDIDNLTTTVNAINNTISGDSVAPIIKSLAGENGATCTTTGTFNVVVSASDNSSGVLQAQASVDGGAYGALVTLPNSIPVSLSGGAHTITVRVQDEAGNTTTETMTAFSL